MGTQKKYFVRLAISEKCGAQTTYIHKDGRKRLLKGLLSEGQGEREDFLSEEKSMTYQKFKLQGLFTGKASVASVAT